MSAFEFNLLVCCFGGKLEENLALQRCIIEKGKSIE